MVVAYLRVSTNKQHLENQQEEIKKFAAHRGLDIDKCIMTLSVEKYIVMTEN